ncbi:MAG: porin, partial [Acidobacteriota bacterium]|nr:porin [Acidobacteriota bacterium]
KKFALKFGGRVQADWTFADVDPELLVVLGSEEGSGASAVFVPASITDGNEFRRARLFVSGTIYEKVEFKVQYDFAGGDADFKDLYVGILDTPVGNVRVGHFKEPFSLEELTSSKYITFLERSLPNAFAPGRNTGIMLHDHRGDRLTWAAGAFRDADDFGVTSDGDGKLSLTGRISGLPVYEDGGQRLVHLGFGYSDRDLGMDSFRYRARPEAHQVPVRFVDTGGFSAEGVGVYNLEAAGVFGRFWFAAEHMQADVDASSLGDPGLGGGYYQAGVFLTRGDHRRYKAKAGTFDRNRPARNFGQGGPGAWEIAVRLSDIDLIDAGLGGGELENVTFAVNWYLNPATRVMFNYVMSDLDRTEDFADTIGTVSVDDAGGDFALVRFQVDF